ncbi:hypothetical protein Tco_0793020 [Tanacetum coccineum]
MLRLADLWCEHKSNALSIWKKLLCRTCTDTRIDDFKLADRIINLPQGYSPKTFTLKLENPLSPADFVVDDFKPDPRREFTFCVDNEAVTFNLDQTMKYSSTNDKSVNRIEIIDEICEEYVPELLGFPSDNFSSGNPTSTSELFTSEFTLEEIDSYLYDKSFSLESDHDDCDPEEDIYVLEKLLNDDPFQLPPMDLKKSEVNRGQIFKLKASGIRIKKTYHLNLEYAFLDDKNDKLPIIKQKVKKHQKEALINVS